MNKHLLLTVVLVIGSVSFAQDYPPGCPTPMCHAVRRILETAPAGFAGLVPNPSSGFSIYGFGRDDDSIGPPTDPTGKGGCSTSSGPVGCWKSFGGRGNPQYVQDGRNYAESVVAGIRAAAPNWCSARPNTSSVWFSGRSRKTKQPFQLMQDLIFTSGPSANGDCSHFPSYIQVVLQHGEPDFVTINLWIGGFSRDELLAAAVTGTVNIESAPPGADVFLDGVAKGNANTEGKMSLTSLPVGKHTISVRTPGRKPFVQEVSIASADPRVVTVKTEAVPLSESEIEDGLQKGITAERMKTLVDEVGVDFGLSNDSERRLRAAGADDALIIEIAKNKK